MGLLRKKENLGKGNRGTVKHGGKGGTPRWTKGRAGGTELLKQQSCIKKMGVAKRKMVVYRKNPQEGGDAGMNQGTKIKTETEQEATEKRKIDLT